jgi:hypothetical protein
MPNSSISGRPCAFGMHLECSFLDRDAILPYDVQSPHAVHTATLKIPFLWNLCPFPRSCFLRKR